MEEDFAPVLGTRTVKGGRETAGGERTLSGWQKQFHKDMEGPELTIELGHSGKRGRSEETNKGCVSPEKNSPDKQKEKKWTSLRGQGVKMKKGGLSITRKIGTSLQDGKV